jgi:hypothetical protein
MSGRPQPFDCDRFRTPFEMRSRRSVKSGRRVVEEMVEGASRLPGVRHHGAARALTRTSEIIGYRTVCCYA